MKSVEQRQPELLNADLWLRQHPTRSKLIAFVMALLLFGLCRLVDSPPALEQATFLDGVPVPGNPYKGERYR
jgi:hypothetical protein